MRFIELRVKVKDDVEIEEFAEILKDEIYENNEGEIIDVTYEILVVKDTEG